MAGVTAFIIGAGMAFGAAIAAGNGKLNWAAVGMVVVAGLVVAAKDYRSLKRLPPLEDGGHAAWEEFMRSRGQDVNGNVLPGSSPDGAKPDRGKE